MKTVRAFSLWGFMLAICVALKVTGHVTWPWLWVLAPGWIPIAVPLAVWAVTFIIACCAFAAVAVLVAAGVLSEKRNMNGS